MSKIVFEKSDLLKFKEIETLILSNMTGDRAKVISNKIKKYILINNDNVYAYDTKNVLYKKIQFTQEDVLVLSVDLIEKSFNALSSIEKDLIRSKYEKTYSAIFKNGVIKSILPQIRTNLTNNDIRFSDPQTNKMHFLNGYYDFEDNEFYARIYETDYITMFIDRKYTKPKEECKTKIYKILNMIYDTEADRNYLLYTLGKALTGTSTKDQTILFLNGLGSTAKSTIMKFLKSTIQGYLFELTKDTFTKGYAKIDKVLNTYLENQCIRISWINELEETKLNDSLFKSFVDGQLQTTSLYQDGCNNFNHYSKLVFTANNFPNIKMDSGVTRRIESYEHKSKFTKNKKEVDEKNHVYLDDDTLTDSFHNDNNMLNTFFSILAEYAHEYVKGKKYKQPANFIKAKDEIICSQDIIQDFIDKAIIKTDLETDRIGREQMHRLFMSNYPKSLITQTQLISSLKQKNIKYNCDFRAQGVKGCFLFVKANDQDFKDDDFAFGEDNKNHKDYKTLYEEQIIKIKQLEKIIEEMKGKTPTPAPVAPYFKELVIKKKKDVKPVEQDYILEIPDEVDDCFPSGVFKVDKPVIEVKREAKKKSNIKIVDDRLNFQNIISL